MPNQAGMRCGINCSIFHRTIIIGTLMEGCRASIRDRRLEDHAHKIIVCCCKPSPKESSRILPGLCWGEVSLRPEGYHSLHLSLLVDSQRALARVLELAPECPTIGCQPALLKLGAAAWWPKNDRNPELSRISECGTPFEQATFASRLQPPGKVLNIHTLRLLCDFRYMSVSCIYKINQQTTMGETRTYRKRPFAEQSKAGNPSQSISPLELPTPIFSGDRRQLSIVQYNCRKNWSNVLCFLHNTDHGSAHELYDIIALQECLPFNATDETRGNLKDLPDDIRDHFELIVGSPTRGDRGKFRNPRVGCFVNKRLRRAPWGGWDEHFLGSDVLTMKLPYSNCLDSKESSTIFIHNIYLDPKRPGAVSAIDQLKQVLEQIEQSAPHGFIGTRDHIVLGDMNIHCPLWGGPTANHHNKFFDFIPIVERLNLTLLLPIGSITHPGANSQNGSTIDLIFASYAVSERLIYCRPRPELRKRPDSKPWSDHIPVETVLDLSLTDQIFPIRRLWKSTKTDVFSDTLRARLSQRFDPLDSDETIDSYVEALVNDIIVSIDASTPVSRACKFSKSWWSKEFGEQRSKARNLRRQVQISKRQNNGKPDPQLHSREKRENNLKIKMARELKTQDATQILSNVTGNGDQYAKQARRIEMRQHPLRRYAPIGSTFYVSPEAAKSLAKEFFPEPAKVDLSDVTDSLSDPSKPFEPLTDAEVKQALETSKGDTAPGSDGIPFETLKLAQPLILQHSVHLFQSSIVHQYCPSHFRESLTYICRKPGFGDYTTHKAYKPVVMRNTFSKWLEYVVASRIRNIVKKQGLPLPSQYIGRHETVLNDARNALLGRVHSAWKVGYEISLLLLDAPKGFENVSHGRLIDILRRLGLPTSLIGWIRSFLSKQRTSFLIPGHRVHDRHGKLEVSSPDFGLPRGSHLSEILYAVYTASVLRVDDESAWPFSCDGFLGILAVSKSTLENCTILKAQSQRIEDWMLTHGCVFDMRNPQLIHFAKDNRSPETILELEKNLVKPVKSVFLLGMIFHCQLYWQCHLKYIQRDVSSAIKLFHSIAKLSSYVKQDVLADVFYMNILSSALRGYYLWKPCEEDRYFYSRNIAASKTLNNIRDRCMSVFSSRNSDRVSPSVTT